MSRLLKTFVAGLVLLSFGFNATEASLLLAVNNGGHCPKHAAKCCCPKVCKVPLKAKPSCHKSDETLSQISLAQTTGDTCVVKAGCDKKENPLLSLPLLKDYLPEVLERIDFDPNRSILVGGQDKFVLLDSSSVFFHPPRHS